MTRKCEQCEAIIQIKLIKSKYFAVIIQNYNKLNLHNLRILGTWLKYVISSQFSNLRDEIWFHVKGSLEPEKLNKVYFLCPQV